MKNSDKNSLQFDAPFCIMNLHKTAVVFHSDRRELYMTMDEKLDLILDKLTNLETRVGNLETWMDSMEAEMSAMKAKMSTMEAEMSAMKVKMSAMEAKMSTMEAEMSIMKTKMDTMAVELRQTQFIMENELNRNIRLVAEGHLDLSRKLDEAIKVSETDVLYHMKVNSVDSEIRRIKDNCQIKFQEFQQFQEVQAAALN